MRNTIPSARILLETLIVRTIQYRLSLESNLENSDHVGLIFPGLLFCGNDVTVQLIRDVWCFIVVQYLLNTMYVVDCYE